MDPGLIGEFDCAGTGVEFRRCHAEQPFGLQIVVVVLERQIRFGHLRCQEFL